MSFEQDITRIANKLEASVEKVARGTFISLFTAVIRDTPVGNPDDWKSKRPPFPGYVGGRLRNNWQTSEGTPATGTIKKADKTASRARADVVNTIKRPGIYYLTNNMPYAGPVERGHSKIKAPRGMMRKNVRRLKSYLRRARK